MDILAGGGAEIDKREILARSKKEKPIYVSQRQQTRYAEKYGSEFQSSLLRNVLSPHVERPRRVFG